MQGITEGNVYDQLRKLNHKAKWQRVENAVGPGTPDVWFCYKGQGIWIENKVGYRSERKKTIRVPKDKLRPGQCAWMTDCQLHGGMAMVAIYAKPTLYVVDFSLFIWSRLGEGIPEIELSMMDIKEILHAHD